MSYGTRQHRRRPKKTTQPALRHAIDYFGGMSHEEIVELREYMQTFHPEILNRLRAAVLQSALSR